MNLSTASTLAAAPAPSAPLTLGERRIAWTCWLLGGLYRLIHLLVIHPATAHVYSDMNGYNERAMNFANRVPEGIADTLYPPGASMLFGLLYRLDASWTLAMIVQWLLSLAVMGLVFVIARRCYGNRTAVIALVLATVYFPFIHYAALWLSENGFTVFVLASHAALLLALQASALRAAVALAVAAGVLAGIAIAFKNTMLGSIAMTGLVLALIAWRARDRRFVVIVLGVVIGLSAVMAPLAARCTRLNEGRFCVSANNLAMNVLLGHYGHVRELVWVDRARNITFNFTAVNSTLNGYEGREVLDFGVYDSAANSALAWQWISAHPAEALRLSLHNVWALFTAPTLWPSAWYRGIDFGAWSQRLFWFFILVPALVTLGGSAGRMLRLDIASRREWLLLAPLLGLMVSVFISITEVRFRVPFDGLLIVLAAEAWRRLGLRLGLGLGLGLRLAARRPAR